MFDPKYANLHLHSIYSDAGFTPNQLVKIGKALGYGALALTDHETDGGCREFMEYAKKEGLESIPGTEFYGMVDDIDIHLTALDFDQNDPGLRAFIKERCDLMYECTRKRVERGIALGFIQGITWDDVDNYAAPGTWVCIDTVFNTLRDKKIPFDGTEIRQNVFKGPEAAALYPAYPTAEQVIKVVRKAGGIIALAHPYDSTPQYIDRLVDWGLNGIEISHPNIRWGDENAMAAAEAYHLYHCGGTDHTGPMSCVGGKHARPVFSGITKEEYDILVNRRLG